MAICFHLLQVLAQSEKYNSIRFRQSDLLVNTLCPEASRTTDKYTYTACCMNCLSYCVIKYYGNILA